MRKTTDISLFGRVKTVTNLCINANESIFDVCNMDN